jgi:hypothetical protein
MNYNDDKLSSRYGTSIDINNNKIINKIDKYTLRNNLIPINNINKYKISRLSIDSRYRNINPKNIIKEYFKLPDNPFIFAKDSNILKIILPKNVSILIDSYITITNIKLNNIIISPNNLILEKNSNLIKIKHINHSFYGNKNYIRINNIKSNTGFLANIPISIINGYHKVILINNNNIIDPDNYFIDINIYSQNYYNYNDTFNIDILTINGVDIKYILASYPISNDVLQGYHNVIETGKELNYNYIKIELKDYASYDTNINKNTYSGGSNIILEIIDSIIDGYPNQNNYKYKFKKPFNKLKKIRLVSTEFPNSEFLINDNINNMLYWQILDDGDYIYKINITSGNYDANTLQTELINKINQIPRVFGNYLTNEYNYYNYCIANINININNNKMTMQILSKIYLSNNITIDDKIYDDNYTRIIITHQYHNLNIGDNIKINNAINVSNIPNDIINKEHIIESIETINSYKIKLSKYNSNLNTINDYGGNAVEITYPLKIKLLFNYSDTIGNILGFTNVGYPNSITNYNSIISNNDLYYNSNNYNSVGIINNNNNLFKMTNYPYILMTSDIFNTNINIKDSTGIFAKLFLTGTPGTYIYDQYIQIIDDIPNTYNNMIEIEFKFLTPDGNLYNFNNIDHSYTLEFYEEI